MIDCCSALCRVYLLGHNVLSVLIFGLGLGSRLDSDGGRCSFCSIHFIDCLVGRPEIDQDR